MKNLLMAIVLVLIGWFFYDQYKVRQETMALVNACSDNGGVLRYLNEKYECIKIEFTEKKI